MANRTLSTSVNVNVGRAISNLRRLEAQIQAVNRAANGTSSSYNNVTRSVNQANNATIQLANNANAVNRNTNNAANSARTMRTQLDASSNAASRLLGRIRAVAATYLGIMGARAVITASDTITSSENRFNNLPGGNAQQTEETMDKIYAAAQRSRANYGDMLSNVSKVMTLSPDAFGNNIDNAIKFQEIMAKSYAVGGASAAEQASSMYQMVQALGAGVLQGDELRSVREGAPLAYKAIEDFAQGVLNTEESLKDLASQGKITSEMVVAAILNMENGVDNINDKFNKTEMTFAQAWTKIKNMALQAFKPLLQALNDALNSDLGQSIIDGIGKAFIWLANTLLWVGNVIGNVITWCCNNWEWLKYVVVGALIVIAALMIQSAAIAIANAAVMAWAWITAHWQLLLIVAAIMAILYVYELWRQGTITTAEAIVYALTIVALAILIIGIVTMNVYLLIIAAVIALVALLLMYFEYIAGGAMWLGTVLVDIILIVWNIIVAVVNLIIAIVLWCLTTIYNVFVGAINSILQCIWAIADPIIGIIEFILNACNGGFDSFGDAVANLIGQVISWFLSLGKVVTKIIDAIFGTDWTSGLNSLQEAVLAWGKNEDAITISREAPELKRLDATDSFNAGMNTFGYADLINPMDAYNTGYNWGAGVKDTVNEWGSKFQSSDYENGIFSGLGKSIKADLLLNPDNPAYALHPDDVDTLLKGMDDLNGTTGDIKDSMDLSNDDLEYLRKIADMEWRNEFTTAEIRIDMTNNNTVNSDRDLDGIVDYLSDVLRSEMTNVAYGVHY